MYAFNTWALFMKGVTEITLAKTLMIKEPFPSAQPCPFLDIRPHPTGPSPRSSRTQSNLLLLASGQFASYWNVFLLDAAYAYTRINSNKTYRVTDESSFMSECRKQEQRHFLLQSVFIFEVKIYKLAR